MKHCHLSIPQDVRDIRAAKEKIRKLLAENPSLSSVTVSVPKGFYLPEDFRFTKKDCSPTCKISYEAEAGAVISGGLSFPASEWKIPDAETAGRFPETSRSSVRMVSLADAGLTPNDWGVLHAIGTYQTSDFYDDKPSGNQSEVFCCGRRMTLARYPKQGSFARLEAVMDVGDVREFPPQNYFPEWDNKRNQRGGAYIIDREINEHVKRWNAPDPWMFGYFYWDWADSSTPVTFDKEHRIVYPKFVSRYAARAGALYFFYNIPEELDAPGEWYLDRKTGELYFIPPCEASPDDTLDFSYVQTPLIHCENTENMTFTGFTLLCTMNDAVVSDGNAMTFSGLTIRNVAGNAVLCKGSRNLVADCDISHTGRGGISVSGGDRATLTHAENRVTDNCIHDFSEVYLTYQAGIHLDGVGCICDHNEIFNSPHMAIGYGGNEHLIEYNNIHHVVLQSSDAGAIYTGFDWAGHGTVIRYNRLYCIGGEGFRPNGIYWDDGQSGQTAYGNLLIGVKELSFLVGGGRENIVEGNVIIDSGGWPIHYDDRNRDGFVHGGWARAATNRPDAKHWMILKQVPRESALWAGRYPHLAAIKTDFSTDPDDIDFPINPAYSSVQKNVIIDAQGRIGGIAESVYTYSTVADNVVYKTKEEAKWDEKEETFAKDSPVFSDLPDFVPIPVSEIGRHPKSL